MSVNFDFQVERKKIEWNGQFAAEVRGMTPNDIVRLIASNPDEADQVAALLDEDTSDLLVGEQNADEIAEALQSAATRSFGKVAAKVPDLLAKVIATACDSPDQWELVRDRFVLPLQFDILQEVARLTFVDPPGFRRFVGNVMALIGAFKTDQRQNDKIDSDG